MNDFIPQEATFTGRKMLLVIVTFFGVIIAVNGAMLTLAVQTFGGLVVSNSYVASQNFNNDIAAAQAQPIRNWTIDVTTTSDTISIAVRDLNGAFLHGLGPSLTIGRPTHDRNSVSLSLVEAEPGTYTARMTLEPGQWRGTLVLADGQTRSLTFTHQGKTL